jgi:Domain of unknown function (DUF4407)
VVPVGKLLLWFSDLPIRLAGGRPGFVDRFPDDRLKFTVIGFTVLFTGSMACVSMAFALRVALHAPLPAAIVAGAAWGVGIIAIDRMLIVSMHRRRHLWLRALPRLLFAVLLGFVISTPFTLQVFGQEIADQVGVIHADQLTAYRARQAQAIAGLQQKISGLTADIAKGSVPGESTGSGQAGLQLQLSQDQQQLGQDQQALKQEESQENSAYAKLQCQLYGGSGCSPGDGPLANGMERTYLDDQRQVAKDQTAISNEQADITAVQEQQAKNQGTAISSVRTELAADQKLLASEQSQQPADAAAQKKVIDADDGLLIRLEALDQITEGSGIAWFAHWGLFALFVSFECLPVLVKILMSSGKPTPYEVALGADEQARLSVFEKETESQRDEQREQVDNDRQARQGVAMDAARAKAEAELRVYLSDLDRWKAGETGQAASRRAAGRGPAPAQPRAPGFGSSPASQFSGTERPARPSASGTRGAGQGAGWLRRHRRGSQRTPGYGRPPGSGPGLPGTFTGDLDDPLPFLREPPPLGTAQANGSGTSPGAGPGPSQPGTTGP